MNIVWITTRLLRRKEVIMKKRIAAIAVSALIATSGMSALSTGVYAQTEPVLTTIAAKLTGWQTIDGGKYYYGKDGKAVTGWKKIGGDTYYFNSAKDGKAVTGFATIGKKTYYFGSDGVMRTGWIKISGDTYYFGSDGAMTTGKVTIGGKSYTFGKDGKLSSGTSSSSKTKSTKKSTSSKGKTTVSWGESIQDVEAKLEGLNYLNLGSAIIVMNGDMDDMDASIYLFDDNESLQMYGTMKPGNTTASQSKSFKNSGYTLVMKEKVEQGTVYVYKKNRTAVIMGDYTEDGDVYTICLHLSPSLSKDLFNGNAEDISGLFESIKF